MNMNVYDVYKDKGEIRYAYVTYRECAGGWVARYVIIIITFTSMNAHVCVCGVCVTCNLVLQ